MSHRLSSGEMTVSLFLLLLKMASQLISDGGQCNKCHSDLFLTCFFFTKMSANSVLMSLVPNRLTEKNCFILIISERCPQQCHISAVIGRDKSAKKEKQVKL